MRTARTALAALVLAGALSVAATAQPPVPALTQPALNAAVAVAVGVQGTVGVDFFYSNLAPYGYWVNRPSYGWVWCPRHIRHGWRPYSQGRWVYTDYGWTWVSAEPYGWATYHYGRWYPDPDYGWSWVPGTDWGPSWVSWQGGDGYYGWAPLPPQVGWSAGVGLDLGGFNLAVGIDPSWYCFVPERSFLAVNVGGFVVPSSRNVAIFNNTTNITNFSVQGGRVFNGSVPVNRIQQVTGQPVRQLQLANASDPRVARVSGNSVAMFRPASVVRRANAPDPPRVAPRAVATGRVAQQLVQQRRGEAAQFRQNGAQQGGARSAQVNAGRNAGPATPAQRQAQMRRQAAPAGRQQQQGLGRRQVTPPPQRTRGGVPPRNGARAQQVHGYVPPPQRAGRAPAAQRAQQAPSARNRQQTVNRRQPGQQFRSRSQAPPPSRHQQSAPPPRQQQFQRQSAPAQHQPTAIQHQGPPPQRQAMAQRQPPPQHQAMAQRQAPPPQRQAMAQRQPPPQRPQRQGPPPQQRRQQPPPPGGGTR